MLTIWMDVALCVRCEGWRTRRKFVNFIL